MVKFDPGVVVVAVAVSANINFNCRTFNAIRRFVLPLLRLVNLLAVIKVKPLLGLFCACLCRIV